MKVLVVDDDRLLADYLRLALKEDGHVVDVATTGEEGETNAMVNEYDVIILDHMLPGSSGVEILRRLRNGGKATPVLMLTARDGPEDLVDGLDAGADDYLVKPFDMAVLRARLRALVRRGGATRSERVIVGDISLDRLRRRIMHNKEAIALTPKEYALMEYLLLNAGKVVTRTELLEKVWDMHFDPGSNVVDVHISRLREKLGRAGSSTSLSTIRGSGFILEEEPHSGPSINTL